MQHNYEHVDIHAHLRSLVKNRRLIIITTVIVGILLSILSSTRLTPVFQAQSVINGGTYFTNKTQESVSFLKLYERVLRRSNPFETHPYAPHQVAFTLQRADSDEVRNRIVSESGVARVNPLEDISLDDKQGTLVLTTEGATPEAALQLNKTARDIIFDIHSEQFIELELLQQADSTETRTALSKAQEELAEVEGIVSSLLTPSTMHATYSSVRVELEAYIRSLEKDLEKTGATTLIHPMIQNDSHILNRPLDNYKKSIALVISFVIGLLTSVILAFFKEWWYNSRS